LKIIGTTEISFEIEQILTKAEKYLILVSPYLKLNQRLKVKLSDAFKKVDSVYILYRENELNYDEANWLKEFKNLKLFSIKNLHSKIYANEEQVLISSMNIYEYSQINNHEIGVKIEFNDDITEYKDTLNEIRVILETDYSDHDFQKIIDGYENYSMGRLFWGLSDNYSFKNYRRGSNYLYQFLSDKARQLVDFELDELYIDETAVLRATELGKVRYDILEKELKKLANEKMRS
jgi:hypothetical protein